VGGQGNVTTLEERIGVPSMDAEGALFVDVLLDCRFIFGRSSHLP
jgi:hypothetical protein